MSSLLMVGLLIVSGAIGGMIGFCGMILIFWPELKRPDQLTNEIPDEWRQHSGLERNDD